MSNSKKASKKGGAGEFIANLKQYWNTPAKGNYVSYKEIATLGVAGVGVKWTTLLANAIGLSAGNFLIGASIGLKPLDLQIMLIVANLVAIPFSFFRSWYFDNHNLKGGKFLPFLRRTSFPIVAITTFFVWLPFESWSYTVKAVVVEIVFIVLQFFLYFYSESFNFLQQIITPNAQERAKVMSISQIIYSLAPTITNFLIPTIAGLTFGLNNIKTYRLIYPIFTFVGLIINTIFFRHVKERLILPKKKLESIRLTDALREVAKNKYFWIINCATWIGFLEGAYGVVLNWSFVYANGGSKAAQLGIANTVIGNAALWSMALAPFAIKKLGKRNLLILCNSMNIILFTILLFSYKNLFMVCLLLFFNAFVNTFANIYLPNINADMKDYHQWKTGVRIDGLFTPLTLIGTVLGFFTGLVVPAIYERMGLQDDYNVLYNDTIRNNLFQVLIVCSIIGAILNLIPYFFYDLTESKHRGYINVLKIRTMFEDYGNNDLDNEELVETMDIINTAKELQYAEKVKPDKTALKKARKMPKKTNEEKSLRSKAIKEESAKIRQIENRNEFIECLPIVMDELNKFDTVRYQKQLEKAKETISLGPIYVYENVKEELKAAKALPKKTKEEKEIRSDAIALARSKKTSSKLIKKYGQENILPPDESKHEEIQNREAHSLIETIKVKAEYKTLLKSESIYSRVTKPYNNAHNLVVQADNYTHLAEIEELYNEVIEQQNEAVLQNA